MNNWVYEHIFVHLKARLSENTIKWSFFKTVISHHFSKAPKYPQNNLMDFNYFFDSLYIFCTYQKYIPFGDSSFLILLVVETSSKAGVITPWAFLPRFILLFCYFTFVNCRHLKNLLLLPDLKIW